jgi:hypothetical protein
VNSPIRKVEDALGLKRTKAGSGDKEQAYMCSKDNLERFAVLLLLLAAAFLIGGLFMKHNLATNKHNSAVLRHQVGKLKSSLFYSKMGMIEAGKEQEAKLVKVLSLLEDHLGRDMTDTAAMGDFSMSMGNAIKQHKRRLLKELKSIGSNEKVKTYLEKALVDAVDVFYNEVERDLSSFGRNNLEEGASASWRMQEIVDSFRKDLNGEIKQETQEIEDETKLEEQDPDWKDMATKYAKKTHKETQDIKDEEHMINDFEENIDQAREISLSPADLNEAKQLEQLSEKLLNLQDDTDKRRPRNQEAIMDKMHSMMKKGGWPIPPGSTVPQEFSHFVQAAKLKSSGDKPKLEEDLKDWEKGKLSDSEMMLDIEDGVEDGGIEAEMLHEGETSKEQAQMLEMDSQDRKSRWLN